MTETAIQTNTVSVTKTAAGILQIPPRGQEDRAAGDALENLAAIHRPRGEEKRPALIDTRGMGTLAREAREGDGKNPAVSGLALVDHSAFSRIAAEMFIGVARPNFPVRMRPSGQPAVHWLISQDISQ